MRTEILVTEGHLKLLGRFHIDWESSCYGAPAVDCKRPYGNSDVVNDIADILGWTTLGRDDSWSDKQHDAASSIHAEMQYVLQILCCHYATGIKPGRYRMADRYDVRSWEKVEA